MKNSFYAKIGFIFLLILTLLIPRTFLSDLVSERQQWRESAYNSIQQSWPGDQTLAGPLLVIPYQLTVITKENVAGSTKKNAKSKTIAKEETINSKLYVTSKKLTINSQVESSIRSRGIYGIPVYNSQLAVQGEFDFQHLKDITEEFKGKKLIWGKPYLSVLVSDQRGIATPPSLKWGAANLPFLPGSQLPGTENGMYAKLPIINHLKEQSITFSFNLELKGMRSVNFALLSDDTAIKLSSNWASPSFTGELLPDQRAINAQGFTAQWRASSFSYNTAGVLQACADGQCSRLLEKSVGFALIQPVDVYQQSERSVKYALLFITLTFVVLILLELLKKLRIHPIQYTLVAMALLMFYLLLISFSEHIVFLYAYTIGAVASTLLLTVYFGAILSSSTLGLALGGGLSVIYSALYVILQAEDTALLMGSVLIFVVLALLMLLTRNLDWYELTKQNKPVSEG